MKKIKKTLLFLSLSLIITNCKTGDFRIAYLRSSGVSDFYYSETQAKEQGIKGYCRVMDKNYGWRVFPYTIKVTNQYPPEYYKYHDAIFIGTGGSLELSRNITKVSQSDKWIDNSY